MLNAWRPSSLLCLGLLVGCSGVGPGPVADPPTAPTQGSPSPTPTPAASAASSAVAASSAPTASPSAAATASSGAGPTAPASKYAACEAPPKGMACIPGGPAIIGADDRYPTEKPRHEVELSTFYLDKTEVTNAAYAECEAAGVCKRDRQILFGWSDFMKPDQPAIAVTWDHANAYCKWAGKRLPTEAEWEKVARGGTEGRTYPWGEGAPSCQRAQYDGCKPATTLPVGSLPAGPYGVFDMAGNGYEWVNDWESNCYRGCVQECGDACFGLDPQGPCAGGPGCGWRKRHVLKGGSWYWPAELTRGAWRRLENSASGAHRLSFRCASSRPTLSTWPPLALSDPLPDLPDPEPPSAAELAAFHDLVEDDDIFKVPLCTEGGGAKVHCREAFSYVVTNEPSQYVWLPFVKNLGGAYVGVGADQAYNFIAVARSRWAWLFDYDPAVVRLHYVIRALLLAYDEPEQFVKAFTKEQASETRRLVEQSLAGNTAEIEATLKTLEAVRNSVLPWYRQTIQPNPQTGEFGWLRHTDQYRYVRKLFQQRRIAIIKGNLLTDKAMPSIAAAARKLGVPVRILYLSNADDQWDVTPQYRKNIGSLPFDERAVVLRTILPRWRQRTYGGEPWDYLVQAGIEEQRRIINPGWMRSWWFAKDAHRGESPYLLSFGLPARTAREPATP